MALRMSAKKREEKIRYIYDKCKNGYSSRENMVDMVAGIVSMECLICKRAFVNNGKCTTKTSIIPCLVFEEID